MAEKVAKFNIGNWVRHTRQGYRAVVIDVDPIFQASGHYNPQAAVREFANRNPWYRLLVDGCSQMTYVEECHLRLDGQGGLIDNPNAREYLEHHEGHYFSSAARH
jgi:heat shock protein HspQ